MVHSDLCYALLLFCGCCALHFSTQSVSHAVTSCDARHVYKTCIALSLSLRLTHWKQDLFLLDQSLEVKEGDRVRGTVRVCRHKLWRRHLRVNLSYTHWRQEQTLSQVGVVGSEWVNNYDTLNSIQEYRKTFALWR